MYYICVKFKGNLKEDINFVKSICDNTYFVCSTYTVSKDITSIVFLFKNQKELDSKKELFESLPEKYILETS